MQQLMILEPAPGVVLKAIPTSLGFTQAEASVLMNPDMMISADETQLIQCRLEAALNRLASVECEGEA